MVVQGTDTLEETAFFLDASLSNEQLHDKPIVLTGAMRSADEADGDGADNLLNAVLVAQDAAARGRGAMVCMYGRIHTARHVRKLHTTRTDAFGSLEHATLGEVRSSHTDNARTVLFHSSAARALPSIALSEPSSAFYSQPIELPRVDIVSAHIACDSLFIDVCIQSGSAAIVVQALGAGNVNPSISAAIERALTQGIAVIIASRSPLGETEPVYGYIGGGQSLLKMGAVMSHDLPAHKARIYAQLLLAQAGATAAPLTVVQSGFDLLKSPVH